MGNFTFDPENHSYTLDGRRIPSVTQVIAAAGLYGDCQAFYTEEAKTRGTYVHAATEMIDRGELDWSTLDPVLWPYCEAYRRFLEDAKPEVLVSEKAMYHAGYLYAGKPDRVFRLSGMASLVDVKSGSPHPATALQLAAYRELVRVNEDVLASKCLALHLRNDGTYRLDEVPKAKEMQRTFQIFLSALSIVRWREEHL